MLDGQPAVTLRAEENAVATRGDGTIAWDKLNKCYVGKLSHGYKSDGS